MIGAIILVVIGAVSMLVAHGAKVRRSTMAATDTVACADIAGVASQGPGAPCEVVGVVGSGRKQLVSPFAGNPVRLVSRHGPPALLQPPYRRRGRRDPAGVRQPADVVGAACHP